MNRLAVLVFALALLALPGCRSEEEAGAWLAGAEAAHVEADRLLAAGDEARAIDQLRQAAAQPAPKGASGDDARMVRQDLFYRLAAAELGRNHAREAAAAATDGLALGHRQDVFTANLLVTRGQAFEQLGDRRAASRDYHDALLVSEALLEQTLGGGGSPP